MRLWKWLVLFRRLFTLCGCLFLAVLVLPLTHVPWSWYRSLAYPFRPEMTSPDILVMMGGGGVPSESGLMRSWKTAEAAIRYPTALVIIAMPLEDGEIEPGPIAKEVIMRGVSPDRIMREPKGRNSREQALEVARMIPEILVKDNPVIGLITSPEHMKRTWYSFQRAGMTNLMVLPAWAESIEADLSYDSRDLGEHGGAIVNAVGGSNMIKYRYWDNLAIMVKCARESVAFIYYRMLGWV